VNIIFSKQELGAIFVQFIAIFSPPAFREKLRLGLRLYSLREKARLGQRLRAIFHSLWGEAMSTQKQK